jgi:hypothetical protein
VNCKNHPGRAAAAICQKHGTGFCGECCECLAAQTCCECLDPKVYCQFRSRCLIWEMSRGRRRKSSAAGGGA